MPANKNAMTRYALIDRMLTSRTRSYSIQDITDILAEQLPEFGQTPVSKRCVEKDLNYLDTNSPFDVEIEEYWIDAADRNDRPYRKRCIRYADPTFSIFKPKFTDEERTVLCLAIETLGCFDGLENFEWLSELKNQLVEKESRPIIMMSKNLLTNSALIARLFSAIKQHQAITLYYHTFTHGETREANVIPHLLKEYNNRWYLIATACDTLKVLTFALDRIDDFQEFLKDVPHPDIEDIIERYEDIIGVTYYEKAPIRDIIFWVSDISMPYIETKPLHGSQAQLTDKEIANLRSRYHCLEGGRFYRIKCKENYELIRELSSFGPELIVLSPDDIRNKIIENVSIMMSKYQST